MGNAELRIRITYLSRKDDSPAVLALTPETYYEPLGDGETYEQDAIPRFDHAYQYTPYSPDELLWTLLEVETVDPGTLGRTVIRTQFLDGRRSMMTHRTDSDGHEEIIHSTEIDPGRWHILRTIKPPYSNWSVTMNNVTDERPGTSMASRDFCGEWSFEQTQSFCNIGRTH